MRSAAEHNPPGKRLKAREAIPVNPAIHDLPVPNWPRATQHRVYVVIKRPANPARTSTGACHAAQAYRRLVDQDKVPLDVLVRKQVELQIERVTASTDVAKIEPMRNPWLE